MAKLSNKDKQIELDFLKWNKSQLEKKDLSGQMGYCEKCPRKQLDGSCNASQEEREQGSLCAKAFNKRERK